MHDFNVETPRKEMLYDIKLFPKPQRKEKSTRETYIVDIKNHLIQGVSYCKYLKKNSEFPSNKSCNLKAEANFNLVFTGDHKMSTEMLKVNKESQQLSLSLYFPYSRFSFKRKFLLPWQNWKPFCFVPRKSKK